MPPDRASTISLFMDTAATALSGRASTQQAVYNYRKPFAPFWPYGKSNSYTLDFQCF